MQELLDEVVANGYEWVLDLHDHPEGLTHLAQIAESLLSHLKNAPLDNQQMKHVVIMDNCQMNQADITAVLLYTRTDVQGDFRSSMITHESGSKPKWPKLYESLGHAWNIRKLQNKQRYVVYHGLHGVALTELEAVVSRIRGGKWVAGFRLPTFFSTSLDIQQAINFAAGEAGTAVQSEKQGMIIEFKWEEAIGVDIEWIRKFDYEREVLIAPWHIAAPDMSRTKYLYDLERSQKGQNPAKVGNFKDKGLSMLSVYSSKKEARIAIENAITFKEVTSMQGRTFEVQYQTRSYLQLPSN